MHHHIIVISYMTVHLSYRSVTKGSNADHRFDLRGNSLLKKKERKEKKRKSCKIQTLHPRIVALPSTVSFSVCNENERTEYFSWHLIFY